MEQPKANVPGSTASEKLAEAEAEIVRLRAALSSVPVIAEEIRLKWDEGMRAGKLLIALTDPKLRYRADITAIHNAIGQPAAPTQPAAAE